MQLARMQLDGIQSISSLHHYTHDDRNAMLHPTVAPSVSMAALASTFNALYERADGLIKPAVFGAIKSLGWRLVPSASRPRCALEPGAAQAPSLPPAAPPDATRPPAPHAPPPSQRR